MSRKLDVRRRDLFAQYAERVAKEEVVVPPYVLPPEHRRRHVRQTLREDHEERLENLPEAARQKFDKMTASPFVFFRGTALLFYRDMAGTDADLPYVLAVGDVHPENFGVMPSADGTPFFGLNDFDEAYIAPYTWDLKRGAVGFNLAQKQNGGSRKQRKKVVQDFVRGYLEGLRAFAADDREMTYQMRAENSPKLIRELLENAGKTREQFLSKLLADDRIHFAPSKKIEPISHRREEFQRAIDDYAARDERDRSTRDGHFHVHDVAIKRGSGTASLGLHRYYVLIDGPEPDLDESVVLEVKQARDSALTGLVPPERGVDVEGHAERIVTSHAVHLVGGDPYYGHAEIDGHSFLIRERSPYKDSLDIVDLGHGQLREYARVCGFILAQAHARSDEDTGLLAGSVEHRILENVLPEVLVKDTARWAEDMAQRVVADWKTFRKDHAMGAFRFEPVTPRT